MKAFKGLVFIIGALSVIGNIAIMLYWIVKDEHNYSIAAIAGLVAIYMLRSTNALLKDL